jgi:hypothetical protein
MDPAGFYCKDNKWLYILGRMFLQRVSSFAINWSLQRAEIIFRGNKFSFLNMEVFITGFGPFTGHPINPSWLLVRHLPDRISINDGEIARLRKHQLPVDYRFIDRLYNNNNNNNNNNHKDHVISAQTTLIVHVGVSGVAKEMLLERQAFNQSKGKDISAPHVRVITAHTQ